LEPLVVNLAAGPGAGKSTTAAGLFVKMKMMGKRVELVTEYAKDLTYEEAWAKRSNQLYVLAKQHHRMERLRNKVDYIITDSPLFLCGVYGHPKWMPAVNVAYQDFHNVAYFIERVKPYHPFGRDQTEDEARRLDKTILAYMGLNNIMFLPVEGDEDAPNVILDDLARHGLI
jgi:hypothetical protein